MNQTLLLLAIAVLVLLCFNQFSGSALKENQEDKEPEQHNEALMGNKRISWPIPEEDVDAKYPLQGVRSEYGGMADGSDTTGFYKGPPACNVENQTNLYKDVPSATGPVYFKPFGNMGDRASSSNGIIESKMAGSSHEVDYCNRYYCNGCADCGSGGATHDTDDIRRNYPGLIDRIRAKQTDAYPFYSLN
jgi:hypothetical protein